MKRILLLLTVFVFLASCGGDSGEKQGKPKTAAPVTSKTLSKDEVLICGSKAAYAYHSHECKGLSRCNSAVSKISLADAKKQGYKACGFCYGKR
ncbi:MAG: hypothetical protein LBH60_04065 [Prevotellaceae bacterium]|jgi:hypothetical protein|nr:hypothetical protein [Prevotellaceae bacterium]